MEAILSLFSNPAFSGLLGVIIGGVLTYLFSVRLEKRRNFNTIAERFRKAFVDEVNALRYTNEDPANILSGSFIKHESAVFELKHVLRGREGKRFEKAWIEYNPGVQHPGNHEPPSMSQYFSMQSPDIDTEEVRALAIKRIENLLRFAKPK